MGQWNPTLRRCSAQALAKDAKHGAPSVRGSVGGQQVPHRAFRPIRNDKIIVGGLRYPSARFACSGQAQELKSWPSRSLRFPNPQRDGVSNPVARKGTRDPSIRFRGGCEAPVRAVPCGTRFHWLGLAARLKSCPDTNLSGIDRSAGSAAPPKISDWRRGGSRALPGRGASKSSEGWGSGIPRLAKSARHGAPAMVVVLADSRTTKVVP